MFSPSRAEQGSYPGPDAVADSDGYGHFRGEGEGETDSAYRDLGLDPDKLTDFNIATDIPFADVEGGDGAGGRGRGTATGALMSPSADERKSRSWRWGRGRSKSSDRGRVDTRQKVNNERTTSDKDRTQIGDGRRRTKNEDNKDGTNLTLVLASSLNSICSA